LEAVNEQMGEVFIALEDYAIKNGLFEREPMFGYELKSATERILKLARSLDEDETSNGAKLSDFEADICPKSEDYQVDCNWNLQEYPYSFPLSQSCSSLVGSVCFKQR
jgi:hypothetical protein